jgi:5-methylthioadenosine/S-adenosylhomocysteine deaminase
VGASLVIQGCLALLGEDAELTPEPVDVVLEGGRIAAIMPAGVEAVETAIDGRNCLLTPGMINGHLHSHEHFQKGRFDNLPLELWMNYVRPPRPVALTERQIYLRTLTGAIEALRSGTTTVVDDLNLGASLDRSHLAAVHQAYEDIGIRALVGISMMDRPFFEGLPFVEEEFELDLLAELRALPIAGPDELLELAEELAVERHPSRNRVGFIVSPSAPQRCTTAFLKATRVLADRHELPLMIHVLETRVQAVTAQLQQESTYIEYLDRIGLLQPNTTLVHGVWLTPRDIEIVARSGATVQHNPWSNLRLGSGIAPLRALLDAGVNISLATDGCASTDTVNMLNSVGLAATLHKIRGDYEDWVDAGDAWRAATRGGARALGRGHDLGKIEAGAVADLVLYSLNSSPFIPANNLLQQLVHSERGASIRAVLVDGRIIMDNGELTGIDEVAILEEIQVEYRKLRPLYDEAEASVARMMPALKRIHRRCAGHPISADTNQARLC